MWRHVAAIVLGVGSDISSAQAAGVHSIDNCMVCGKDQGSYWLQGLLRSSGVHIHPQGPPAEGGCSHTCSGVSLSR